MNQEPIAFYTKEYPSLHDSIVVEVVDFNDVRVNCTMCEYADYPAMLPTTEIKIKRGKRVSDYVKKGKQIVAQIIRVEEVGGEKQFDLSLKQITPEESNEVFDSFYKMQKVIQIVSTASKYKKQESIDLLKRIWEVVEEKEIEHPYLYLESILVGETDPLTPEVLDAVKLRMNMPSYTVEKEITLQFTQSDGVTRLEQKLTELASIPDVKVFVLAPPKYKLQATAVSKAKAQALLDKII